MTAPSLLGIEWISWRHFARSIFFHSSRMTSFRDWMLDGEWCSTCLFRIPHRCSIGFRSGDILGHWITFTLFFFRNPTVALDVCLGSLSCWKSARRPRARSDGSIFSFSIEQYICEFMMPSMKCSSPTPAALMQPHIRTLPPPCFTVGTMHFSLYFLTFATPYSFEAISSKNIYLGLITPEYRVPVVFIFVSMGPGKL